MIVKEKLATKYFSIILKKVKFHYVKIIIQKWLEK